MASRPDSDARGALDARTRLVATFAWLDIDGAPIRVADAPYPVTFAGTGDPDLDGFTFDAVDPRMVSVGPVKAKEGGTDTVTLTLSGIAGVDHNTMNDIGDRTKWAERDGRLWHMMRDPATLAPIGAVWSHYTGYMTVPKITGDRQSQTIELSLESYFGLFTQASNRGYLQLAQYDAADHSAELAIAIANGASKRK